MEKSNLHTPSNDMRDRLQSAAPQWMNDNVMGIVSGLKFGGATTAIFSSGLGSANARVNPWRLASLGTFFGTQGLGMAFPEKPDTKQNKQELEGVSWPRYAARKISYAFDPKNHIRETHGLLTIASGALLIPAYKFERNPAFRAELTYAAASMISGASMLLAKKSENGWQLSTGVQLAMVPFQVKGFWDLMRNSGADKGASWKGKWLLAGSVLFTASNLIGLALGGNERQKEATPKTQIDGATAQHAAPVAAAPEDHMHV